MPSLESVTHISLVIMKDCFTVSETYTLTLPSFALEEQDTLANVERSMRDLILSVLSLEGMPRKRFTEDASFKLTVRTAGNNNNNESCPETLARALNEGTWYYRPTNASAKETRNEKVQPLFHLSFPSGSTLQMNLITNEE